jgi:excisionase family DNA binding protein
MRPAFTLFEDELRALIREAVAEALRDLTAQAPAPANGSTPYLDTRQAADLLGCSRKGLEATRARGEGPPYVRIGRRVRYRREDLERYAAPRSEPTQAGPGIVKARPR